MCDLSCFIPNLFHEQKTYLRGGHAPGDGLHLRGGHALGIGDDWRAHVAHVDMRVVAVSIFVANMRLGRSSVDVWYDQAADFNNCFQRGQDEQPTVWGGVWPPMIEPDNTQQI